MRIMLPMEFQEQLFTSDSRFESIKTLFRRKLHKNHVTNAFVGIIVLSFLFQIKLVWNYFSIVQKSLFISEVS